MSRLYGLPIALLPVLCAHIARGQEIEGEMVSGKVSFFGLFEIILDTGNPYLDALGTVALLVIAIGGILLIRRQAASQKSKGPVKKGAAD